jgi:O-antigen/teichoic acid export membrane protein
LVDFRAPPALSGSRIAGDLGLRMAKGAAWMIALRFAVRATGLVSMIILARLLVPADFGLVALATALAGALAAMSEFGFEVALIQNPAADRRHYDTAWTLGLIRGVIVAGVLAACAGPLAAMLSDQRLEPVLRLLALGVVIAACENIAVVDFRKNLQFHKEFAYRAVGKLVSFAITVPLAIILRGYWALVAGIVAGQAASVLLSYVMCRYRPRLSVSVWRELVHFTKWLLLNSILFFIYQRTDTFVIGRFAGASPLGVYAVAHEVASLPATEMVAPVRAALLPGYAKLASDRERLRASFATTFGLIVIVALPVAVNIGLLADPLVRIAFGEQWLAAIPALEVLAVYGAINVCVANSWPVFIALGRPWINTALTGLGTILLIPLLLWGVHAAGIVGAAWSLVAVAGLVLGCTLGAAVRLLSLSPMELLARVWRSFLAASVMSVAVIFLEGEWPELTTLPDHGVFIGVALSFGSFIYLTTLGLLWFLTGCRDDPEPQAVHFLRRLLPDSLVTAGPRV